jgi:hypothetical protein
VLLTRFYMLVRKNNPAAKQAVQCSHVLPCDPLVHLFSVGRQVHVSQ